MQVWQIHHGRYFRTAVNQHHAGKSIKYVGNLITELMRLISPVSTLHYEQDVLNKQYQATCTQYNIIYHYYILSVLWPFKLFLQISNCLTWHACVHATLALAEHGDADNNDKQICSFAYYQIKPQVTCLCQGNFGPRESDSGM